MTRNLLHVILQAPVMYRLVHGIFHNIMIINTDEFRHLDKVIQEFERSSAKHGRMLSPHEGYAIILEELDEAWDEIKQDNHEAAFNEIVQVAAMALRFLYDLYPKSPATIKISDRSL